LAQNYKKIWIQLFQQFNNLYLQQIKRDNWS